MAKDYYTVAYLHAASEAWMECEANTESVARAGAQAVAREVLDDVDSLLGQADGNWDDLVRRLEEMRNSLAQPVDPEPETCPSCGAHVDSVQCFRHNETWYCEDSPDFAVMWGLGMHVGFNIRQNRKKMITIPGEVHMAAGDPQSANPVYRKAVEYQLAPVPVRWPSET